MPTISIILPVHNAASTLLETVRSVQRQTFSDFEIVAVNNGSTDHSKEILNNIADQRLRVLTCDTISPSSARNYGLARATGEFIAFLDGDDLWTPDKLETQLAALRRHPEAGAAYSWVRFVDAKGKLLYQQQPVIFEGNVYPQMLQKNFLACGSVPLIRRPVIESVGEFNTSLGSSEDWDYWLRIAARWSFVNVPKYQTDYRQSLSSATSKVAKREKYNLIIIERAFQAAGAELQYLKNRSLAENYLYLSELYLRHNPNSGGVKLASQKIRLAIQLNPKILTSIRTARVLQQIARRRFLHRPEGNLLKRSPPERLID
ncbi:MAG: glycosyltransferase [Kastovskya adunca ATA6-11-RM4]|jgi:glycosyltransferase involved in cell wall biosynthesis|nr:glycosyltransferase [Kastovskya adunca ATA6-11-RM4]